MRSLRARLAADPGDAVRCAGEFSSLRADETRAVRLLQYPARHSFIDERDPTSRVSRPPPDPE